MTRNEVYPKGSVASHSFDIFSCVANPGELQTDEVKSVYWAKPDEVLLDMQNEVNKNKYCGGFRASLPIYLKTQKKHLSSS